VQSEILKATGRESIPTDVQFIASISSQSHRTHPLSDGVGDHDLHRDGA